MLDAHAILGVAPWMALTALVTWISKAWLHGDARRERKEAKAADVDMHRDDLTLRLIKQVTQEAAQVRAEIAEVREENRALRAIEEHFYHFQQALEHLEAVLTASDVDARAVAEKNANSFLARMRRLQQAKGTIQQEIQVVESAHRLDERDKK